MEGIGRVESGTETESNAWSGCRDTEGAEKNKIWDCMLTQ